MGKTQNYKGRYSKSNSKTGLIKACSKWLKAHILTVLYIITFIAIVAIGASLYFENEKVRFVALCACIALLFFTGTTSFTKCGSKSLIGFYRDCWEWIKTHIITIIIALSLVFVFLYFEKEIVEASFSFVGKIEENKFGNVLLWILGIVVLGTLIYNIINKTKHKTLSDGRTFFFSLVLCSLFVYCWTQYPWETVIDPEIKNPIANREWAYIVLFSVFALCFIVLPFILYFIVKRETELYDHLSKSRQKESFLSDAPITNKNEDELHFGNHIQALKNRIEEMPNTGTHSIAITGGWGTGKTSFLNLLQQELLVKEQYEIMWFNPLKSSKSGNIQNDFFDVLESSLSKYKMGFGRRIKYYKELIGAIDNKYVSFLVKLGSIQLEDEKKRINDVIRMIPKKIIIIIDDVDRLNGDEIMQIFRLVGFNAEFDNVVFLIPLDKANVVKALGCDPNYPDKFFEMEFPLPDNNRNATSLYVKKALQRLVPDIQMSFLKDQTITEYTTYCISNLRDANRFINSFLDRVKMIYTKLDVCSFYLLSLIRYKSPALYEQIKRKDCLVTHKDSSNETSFVVKKGSVSNDHILYKMLLRLFQNGHTSKSGHFIFQPKYFDDYFNETSTKSITDAMLMRLLLSESDEELRQTLNDYTNDDISRQSLIDLWESPNSWIYAKSLFDENGAGPISNYYSVINYLKINDHWAGFSSDLLAPIRKDGNYRFNDKEGNGIVPFEYYDWVYPFTDGLARVRKDGKWGFIDKEGKVVVPLVYDWAESFSEGFARVRKDGQWGFINKEGNVVVPLDYDAADSFSEGFAGVRKDGKWGYVDKEGKVVVPFDYEAADLFSDGLAHVRKDGKWGYLSKEGNFVIPLYDNANSFSDGLACVRKDGKYGYMDKDGNVVVPIEFDDVHSFSEGLAPVEKDGKWGYVDEKGNVVVPLDYDLADSFSEGLARVRKDGKYGYVDKEGKVVVPLEFDAYSFSEGLARVRKDGKWGFIDKDGNVVVPLDYDVAYSFSEGLAPVEKDGKWGYVNKEGNVVVPLDYDLVKPFSKGLAPVEKDGKWGYVDKEGNVIVPLEFDDVHSFSEGLAPVEKDGKWGYVDEKGNVVVPLDYDLADSFSEGLARARKDGKYGYVDKEGKVIVPLEFDNAYSFSEGFALIEKDGKWGFIDRTGSFIPDL